MASPSYCCPIVVRDILVAPQPRGPTMFEYLQISLDLATAISIIAAATVFFLQISNDRHKELQSRKWELMASVTDSLHEYRERLEQAIMKYHYVIQDYDLLRRAWQLGGDPLVSVVPKWIEEMVPDGRVEVSLAWRPGDELRVESVPDRPSGLLAEEGESPQSGRLLEQMIMTQLVNGEIEAIGDKDKVRIPWGLGDTLDVTLAPKPTEETQDGGDQSHETGSATYEFVLTLLRNGVEMTFSDVGEIRFPWRPGDRLQLAFDSNWDEDMMKYSEVELREAERLRTTLFVMLIPNGVRGNSLHAGKLGFLWEPGDGVRVRLVRNGIEEMPANETHNDTAGYVSSSLIILRGMNQAKKRLFERALYLAFAVESVYFELLNIATEGLHFARTTIQHKAKTMAAHFGDPKLDIDEPLAQLGRVLMDHANLADERIEKLRLGTVACAVSGDAVGLFTSTQRFYIRHVAPYVGLGTGPEAGQGLEAGERRVPRPSVDIALLDVFDEFAKAVLAKVGSNSS